MKLNSVSTNSIIDILNDFSIKADLRAADDMHMIAETMKKINGNVFMEVLEKAINKYLLGLIDIKKPYRINNQFISELINKYFDSNRSSNGIYEEEETIRPSDEEINEIFEIGTQVSKERVIKFMSGEDTFFSPFLLYNEYDWLQQNKGLDPNDFEDTDIHKLTGELMRHDSTVKGKFEAPEMKEADYMKAACVALFLVN